MAAEWQVAERGAVVVPIVRSGYQLQSNMHF